MARARDGILCSVRAAANAAAGFRAVQSPGRRSPTRGRYVPITEPGLIAGVELLIVIAILATIVGVAYSGIVARASEAALKSDLQGAASQL